MKDILEKSIPDVKVEEKGKDLIVKSKDRMLAKSLVEKFLSKNKIKFSSVFKKNKSSSLEVLSVPSISGDIIFKPIIQKGAGGLSFEKELMIDLENYFNGAELNQLKHPDVVGAIHKSLKWKDSYIGGLSVKHEGAKNQKRDLMFSGSSLKVNNSSGATLTDLTLVDKRGKETFLSLKMSKSYYTLSASIFKFFLAPATKKQINEFFGFNGIKMAGFGKEYGVKTGVPNYSKVKGNLADVLSQAIGYDVVLVHKKSNNDVVVKSLMGSTKVSITGTLGEANYLYPELNVRKYANIKFNASIGGINYKINFQFRGTTAADKGPKYLRILMER